MQYGADDLSALLTTLERLEAERKLRSMPSAVLETAWVLDAQVEAVIDAVLVVATAGDHRAFAHARHTGEWASRIAAEVPDGPDPSHMRRSGALAGIDPALLARIPELREYAAAVTAFQSSADSASAKIIAAASAFDELIAAPDAAARYAPGDALRMLCQSATPRTRGVIDALRRACRNAPEHLFAVA
jgi:hypothetical protein